jgi:hypothetical protein
MKGAASGGESEQQMRMPTRIFRVVLDHLQIPTRQRLLDLRDRDEVGVTLELGMQRGDLALRGSKLQVPGFKFQGGLESGIWNLELERRQGLEALRA